MPLFWWKERISLFPKNNSLIGSIDHVDELLQPYNTNHKSYMWIKKFDIHIASRLLLNAQYYSVLKDKENSNPGIF